MKKLLGIAFLCLLSSVNVQAKDGSGDLRFNERTFNNFLSYLRGDGNDTGGVMMSSGMPIGFAINQNGNYSFYYYCPKKYGDNCMPGGHVDAQNKCSIQSKKNGQGRCFVFAKGRKIVWDSVNYKIKKKPTINEIKELFSKNGWYGKIEEKKPVLKKKPKNKGSSQLDKMNTLKKLFDDGLITPEEFLSRKKIILN